MDLDRISIPSPEGVSCSPHTRGRGQHLWAPNRVPMGTDLALEGSLEEQSPVGSVPPAPTSAGAGLS